MQADIDHLRSLRANGFSAAPTHGEIPQATFTRYLNSWYGLALGMVIAFFAFFILWAIFSFIYEDHKVLAVAQALNYGLSIGIWIALLYYIYPVFAVLFKTIRHGQWPNKAMLNQYSTAQIYVSFIVFSLILCFLLNSATGIVISWLHGHFSWNSRYIPSWWTYSVVSISIGIVLGFLLPKVLPYETQPRASKKEKALVVVDPDNLPFGLWVGRSTGHLSQLCHRTGVAGGQDICLSLEDAAQNILVFGAIGSGKTTRLMQPLLAQLLEQECGGIVFDVKGDVKEAVLSIAKYCNVDVAVIGPGENTWSINILGGLTPEIASSFLKSALLLSSGTSTDGFWIETATELLRNTLGVLSFIEGHYNLHSLYNYLFKDSFRDEIQEKASLRLDSLEEEEQESLKDYMSYYEDVFTNFDEKMKKSVLATAAQVLTPFKKRELIKAFCQDDSDTMDMTALFNRWVFLVDLPLSRFGLGAKLVYTFIKLRFFNLMQDRIKHPEWNQTNPVFFMCDEYQELISANRNGLSDLNFWDKSRSSKTIGIVSAQSVSSFYAAIGNHDLANAVIQNFRQKFCFKTDDRETLNLMNDLAGQARVQKMTVSQGSTIGHDGKQSYNSNESIAEAREAVLDAPLFRQLEENRVVGLLSVNGLSMDDVFWLVPFYV